MRSSGSSFCRRHVIGPHIKPNGTRYFQKAIPPGDKLGSNNKLQLLFAGPLLCKNRRERIDILYLVNQLCFHFVGPVANVSQIGGKGSQFVHVYNEWKSVVNFAAVLLSHQVVGQSWSWTLVKPAGKQPTKLWSKMWPHNNPVGVHSAHFEAPHLTTGWPRDTS